MTDKKKVLDESNKAQATTTSEEEGDHTGPTGGPEPPAPTVYVFSGIAAGAAWLISPHVKALHHILWWILPFLFLLIGFFGWYKTKD